MKRKIVMMLFLLCLVIAPTKKADAIWWVVIKAAVKKAILAADLAIQRQQNKVIWLQNAQKVLENAMSKLKLNEISDWTQRQKDLYQHYFDELNKVKSLITYYQRVKEISQKQLRLVDEYKRAWSIILRDKHFSPQEVSDMGKVYSGILDETVENIDQISMVLSAFATSMTDAKRLGIINAAADRLDQNFNDLQKYNTENFLHSLRKSKNQGEIEMVKEMYGIN